MLGVFMDTIIVCTATAAIILVSGALNTSTETGIALTQQALISEIGPIGQHMVAVAILMFAFSSIIANYYYGESNLRFILNNRWLINVYRLGVLAMVFWGATSELPQVWAFADASMGLMALINLIAILMLSGIVGKVYKTSTIKCAQASPCLCLTGGSSLSLIEPWIRMCGPSTVPARRLRRKR